MHAAIAAVGFALGASAAIIPRQQCCFSLTASGGASGSVSQLSDGQNRIGGSGSPASYCMDNGAITDSNGRGCILTPPTTQFQCDVGASPSPGFSVSGSGMLEGNGTTQFYACPATDSSYNIYTSPVEGQDKCVEITLSTGGQCSGSGGSGSASGSAGTAPATYGASSSATSATSTPATYGASSAASTQVAYSSSTAASSESAPSAPGYSAPGSSSAAQSTPTQAGSTTSAENTPVTYVTSMMTSTETAPCITSSAPGYSAASSGSAAESTTAQMYPEESSSAQTYPTESSLAESTPAQTYPAESTPATGTQPAASGSASASACQTDLSGAYQTPHLIVPVSSSSPDTAYGTCYNGQVNSTTSTIFSFGVPESSSGKTCSIVFLFPEQNQLQTSSYTFSGSGSIVFTELSSEATDQTTWATTPNGYTLSTIAIQPGNSYVVASESCPAGTTQTVELSSSGGLALNFFQDYNPSPLGMFMTSC